MQTLFGEWLEGEQDTDFKRNVYPLWDSRIVFPSCVEA
jgi:hypothetical protein